MRYLFLLFIIMPVLEISLLIRVGGFIGVWPTVALVLTSAFVGAYLLRQQGLQTLFRINQRMAAGEIPAREMLEGVVLAVGGALLLTPGFITDILGLLCVLPGSRHLLVRSLFRRVVTLPRVHPADPFAGPFTAGSATDSDWHRQPSQPLQRPTIIEGEFERDDRSPPR